MNKILIIVLFSAYSIYPSTSFHKIEPSVFLQNPEIEQSLYAIYTNAFATVYNDDWHNFKDIGSSIFKNNVEQFKTNNNMLLIAATKNNQLSGWILFLIEQQTAIIELICIDPNYWRQGMGKALIFSIRDYFPEVNHIAVITRKVNTLSPLFYEALGFKKTKFSLPEYGPHEMQGYELFL